MPKLIKTALLLSLIALLTACASPARIAGMTASPQPSLDPNQTHLKESIRITQVSGGQETNPMWTSQVDAASFRQALEQSLRQAGLLGNAELANHYLSAELIDLDQPLIGASFTVTARVRYELIDADADQVVYQELITQPYTAQFSDAFIGTERLKLANEGAIRNNIEALIEDLYQLKPSLQ